MKDVLIVGFGLAGLSVAYHCQDLNLTIDIVNDNSQKSSRIAGGLLNPVAIKHMKPVWNIEEFLPYAINYYSLLEKKISFKFLNRKQISVFIRDTYKENLWFEALDNTRVVPFISSQLFKNKNKAINTNNLGQVDAHLINLSNLFELSANYYKKINSYFETTFKYEQLKINQNDITYNDKKYRHIFFCEGYGIVNNPFFNQLDMYGNKGDYLIFEAKNLKSDAILKSKYFLIPLGNNKFKFGATYQRKPLNHFPSENAKLDMLETLDKMINCNYKIIDQVCGIRPTTKDRKPIVGSHHKYENMHVLNGFGSRGVMTSPLLGKLLIQHIFNAVPLPKEVSIHRFHV